METVEITLLTHSESDRNLQRLAGTVHPFSMKHVDGRTILLFTGARVTSHGRTQVRRQGALLVGAISMNLSEFQTLIAEYALEHPERPLSDVSMVEFAAWRDTRAGLLTPEEIMMAPFPRAEGSPRCDLCKDTGWRRSVERGRKVPCECGALARARERGAYFTRGAEQALARGHKPR